jgi:hypothetical protein
MLFHLIERNSFLKGLLVFSYVYLHERPYADLQKWFANGSVPILALRDKFVEYKKKMQANPKKD